MHQRMALHDGMAFIFQHILSDEPAHAGRRMMIDDNAVIMMLRTAGYAGTTPKRLGTTPGHVDECLFAHHRTATREHETVIDSVLRKTHQMARQMKYVLILVLE